jgi:hypothetical protein
MTSAAKIDGLYTAEESKALLLAIFPNYPDLRGMRKEVPDVDEFLRRYREEHES